MSDEKISKKQAHIYDVVNMTVTAWGHTFKYERFDSHPEEAKEYCLKGFIDDLQDCTTSIKRSDYAKTPEGEDLYRVDCLRKRKELMNHINAGTRPARANGTGAAENKLIAAKVKEVLNSKVVSFESLAVKRVTVGLSAEEEAKFQEFMKRANS